MKKWLVLVMFAFLASCRHDPQDQVEFLNGYWEISEVQTTQGNSKTYSYNTTIDYIYIDDNKGFRKKMQPGINNQYKTSDDIESLEVRIENDSLNLYYSTNLTNWKETVLKANEKELEIINADQIIYIYKRYEPVNLDLEQ